MRRFERGPTRWAIDVRDDGLVQLIWGDLGKPEQRHDRRHPTREAAAAYADAQIDKLKTQGYTEVLAAPPPPPPAPVVEKPVRRSTRYEEPNSPYHRLRRRFIEVEQHDHRVILTRGELADPTATKRRDKTYATIAKASAVYDEEVDVARVDDWKRIPLTAPARPHSQLELEQQCLDAADDDAAPWEVYADWLLEQGDPLGELVTSDDATAAALVAAAIEDRGEDPAWVTIERRHGVPRAITVRSPAEDIDVPEGMIEVVRAVRQASCGRFLDAWRFGLAAYSHDNDWAPVLRALADTPHPERIRELRFDAFTADDCEISWAPMGDLSGLFEAFSNLEVLHVKSGGGGTLGELDFDRLTTFIRESGGLSDAEIESICRARWPRLQHLEIWFGNPRYGATSTVASIRRILDGRKLRALRHLGIVNCHWVEDAIEALASSRILPQLSSLDLSHGILARRGAELLTQHAHRFRHLASIDLSRNLLIPDEVAQIRGALDNVIVVEQRPRDDDYEDLEADGEDSRYVAVGE